MKRPKQCYPLVEVWWDDASPLDGGWDDKIEHAVEMVMSVGFLLEKTKTRIVLAMDIDKDAFHNGRAQIPRGMVKSLKVLRKADK